MNKVLKFIPIQMFALIISLYLFGCIGYARVSTIKDVPTTDGNYQQIQWVLDKGYMGVTNQKFMPNNYVKRNEFAEILAKLNGEVNNLENPTKATFQDEGTNDQYFRYIETEKKHMTSYKNAKGFIFKPNANITREDVTMSVVSALGYDSDNTSSLGDVSLNGTIADGDKVLPSLVKYVYLAIQNDLIDLRHDGGKTYFDPKNPITRKQLALFIYNAYQNKDSGTSDETTVVPGDNSSTSNGTTNNSNSNTNTNINNISNSANTNTSNVNPPSITQDNDAEYFKMTINGNIKTYTTKDEVDLDSTMDTFITFNSDDPLGKDGVIIRIPIGGKVGDVLAAQASSEDMLNINNILNGTALANNNTLRLEYTNSNGETYGFGYPLGGGRDQGHKSSNAVVKFTQWDANGGYIMGTFEGQITLYSNQIINFTNGQFKIKVKSSGF